MKSETQASSPESRAAFVLKRDAGQCTYRTEPTCDGIATKVLCDGSWLAFGLDGAPLWAVRSVCQACFDRWAR